jgi:transcriptional regulator with XRE-family HTH domain
MPTGDSPLVARRRVRLTVREAREAKGLTQGDVAEAMEWSLSKVIRIENGDVSISPNDLRPLLAYLGITDRAAVDGLLQATRTARERRTPWWHEAEYRDHISPAMAKLIEAEYAAVVTWAFNPTFFPGRLQLPEYAEALLSNYSEELPPGGAEARLRARLRRREDFLKPNNTSHTYLLIDVSVLYRTIGVGAKVLSAQLTEMIRLSEQGRISVRVIPFDFDGPLPSFGLFELFYLTEDRDHANALLYSEDFTRDEISEDRLRIERHRAKLDQLWELATNEHETLELIRTRVKELATRPGAGPGTA